MDHAQALVMVGDLQAQATSLHITLRAAPPAPTTCCGRGCHGCVWEGYFDAITWWREDALAALAMHADNALN